MYHVPSTNYQPPPSCLLLKHKPITNNLPNLGVTLLQLNFVELFDNVFGELRTRRIHVDDLNLAFVVYFEADFDNTIHIGFLLRFIFIVLFLCFFDRIRACKYRNRRIQAKAESQYDKQQFSHQVKRM